MKNKLSIITIKPNEITSIPFTFDKENLHTIQYLQIDNQDIYGFDYDDNAKVVIVEKNKIVSGFTYSQIYRDINVSPKEFVDFHLSRLIKKNSSRSPKKLTK